MLVIDCQEYVFSACMHSQSILKVSIRPKSTRTNEKIATKKYDLRSSKDLTSDLIGKEIFGPEMILDCGKTLVRIRKRLVSERFSYDGFTGLPKDRYQLGVELLSYWREDLKPHDYEEFVETQIIKSGPEQIKIASELGLTLEALLDVKNCILDEDLIWEGNEMYQAYKTFVSEELSRLIITLKARVRHTSQSCH